MGRHPMVWKLPSGVVIHKPDKDNCTKLEAYCTIPRLSCVRKELEKVAEELQSEEAKR